MIKRNFLSIILLLMIFNLFAQKDDKGLYFGEKGFLPGSICVIVDFQTDSIFYEVYNHYYTDSYREIKKGIIVGHDWKNPSDSVVIIKKNRKIEFIDYSLDKKIKIKPIESKQSANRIRNLSYADKKARMDSTDKIRHWDLWADRDEIRNLTPEAFKRKADILFDSLMR